MAHFFTLADAISEPSSTIKNGCHRSIEPVPYRLKSFVVVAVVVVVVVVVVLIDRRVIHLVGSRSYRFFFTHRKSLDSSIDDVHRR